MSYNPIADLDSALWCEVNPASCPCNGSGWLLSDYDTWHRCAAHGNGVPHPEDDSTPFDASAHRLECLRQAYSTFRDAARKAGFEGNFKAAVVAAAEDSSPQGLVNAAEALCAEFEREFEENMARRQGYCCALEMRLAEETERERKERSFF